MSDELGPHVLKVDRRLFLRGVGGALLALPVLPSLLTPSEARAQAAAPAKCFAHFRTPHGGVLEPNMYPPDSALTEQQIYTHSIRRGALTAAVANGTATLSPVLSGPSTRLTPSLVAKMNVLRGLDIPTDLAHNFGGCLGYYGRDQQTAGSDGRATIDQLIAFSPAVYPSVDSVKRRSVVIGSQYVQSGMYGFQTPGVRSSGLGSQIQPLQSSLSLFESLFAGSTSTATPRRPIVDRVLDNYNRLRKGSKRLSGEDKNRLDQHITAIAELQRRLNTVTTGCVIPPEPSEDSWNLQGEYTNPQMDGKPDVNVQFFQLFNEVVAVAMNCGACRVASYTINENFLGCTFTTTPAQGEGWHNNTAHGAEVDAAQQARVVDSHRTFFAGVFLDLISRLDSFGDGHGGTLLDHSLVAWGQESGWLTHETVGMPVITAGSAGGALKTGNYCDYRDLNRSAVRAFGDINMTLRPGLVYNQWLTNALMAMGVPKPDWEETTHPGYGARMSYTNGDIPYSDALWARTGEMLPWLG